jgi:hypothetical protein
VHAGNRHRLFGTNLAVVNGHDAPSIDAPRYLVFILAGGYARIALNAALGITLAIARSP